MLVVCPSCATSYDVEVANLRPGRQLRCVRCRAIWQAAPSEPANSLVPEPDGAAVPLPDEPLEPAVAAAVTPATAQHRLAAETDAAGPPLAEPSPEPSITEAAPPGSAVAVVEPENSAIVVEAPQLAPAESGEAPVPITIDHDAVPNPSRRERIKVVAARRFAQSFKPRTWRWPLARLQSATVALLIVDAVVVGWRADVVRILPQTASFYALLGLGVNVRGLVFDGVTTTAEQHEGVPILVVQGHIINTARRIVDVPRLIMAVRNASQQEIYSWTATPPRASLNPGESVAFRTRLASPPPDGQDVVVRFLNHRDIVAGLR